MNPPPKNRWLRFSLRTMLVVVTVACVLLASKVRQAERQREVVAWVNANGTRKWCTYDFETGDCKPPGPEWLIEMLGVDYLATVVEVSLWGDDITDISPLAKLPQLRTLLLNGTHVSDLRPLRMLSSLTYLNLNGTQVRDLTPLVNMADLEELNLNGTPVADLTPLKQLSKLRKLYLTGCRKITEEEIMRFHHSLPECHIFLEASRNWSPLLIEAIYGR